MGLYQNKNLLHSEGNNKIKRQPTEWEKIFANDTSDKGSLSKIHKELIQLEKNKSNLKMGRRPEQTFLQRQTHRWPTDT